MKHRRDRGFSELTMMMTLVVLSGVILSGFLSWTNARNKFSKMKQTSDIQKIQITSGVETFMQAYRAAERSYLRQVSSCGTAKPFMQAIVEGSGCGTSITVFNASTGDAGNGVLYSYPSGGCQIGVSGSNCVNENRVLVTVGVDNDSQKIGGSSFSFAMSKAWSTNHYLQFKMTEQRATGSTNTYEFVVKNYFSNAAHLDSNFRVVQESPDPLAICAGTPWADYPVYMSATKKCVSFQQLGGGTGLVYYRGRFFGFRPADGLIVDLLAANSGNSYIVDWATGRVGSETTPAFVPYPNPANTASSLINIDDLTMIDNQMYFVANGGVDAYIGYVDAAGNRMNLCQVGQMGWAQAYNGIAAASWSDPLIPGSSNPLDSYLQDRFATFFLKTDSGDLITASVVRTSSGSITCVVSKDQNLQQIEYKRTFGFDRALDERPYYIF